jgi:hypothetical protein
MKTKKLNLQALDAREVPAVFAHLSNDDLVVTGDSTNDQIQVSRLPGGITQIVGMNGTRVNGTTNPLIFSFGHDMNINLGEGNNLVYMPQGNGGVQANSLNIKTGSGKDVINIYQFTAANDITIDTGNGDDGVFLDYAIAADNVHTGGDDGINVYTRGGSDFVQIYNSYSNGDVVALLEDPPGVGQYGGADTLYMGNVTVVDDVWIWGFGGNDSFYLDQVGAGDNLSVDMGDGNDNLKLTNSHASYITTIGGSGIDTVQYYADAFYSWNHSGVDGFIYGP